ncbi:helix-turn-helix domain-containing protein [Kordiimonas lacus]|uniref:Helix-turn-helix domain-containing protein n=1 Tax=Kordiimonas lacus TaxID=637679 RepID=A0A1G7DPC6_9PROT|nr:helix-turn-helix domain-containing protein [Kordiimonas lacus]SDE53368.1 Helix-turn-helix domain-containing protein [Kordiimonas lacus]
MDKPSVGALIKDFRKQAGMSQLDLACEADISQRHLSFVETGRTGASRELIDQLVATMGLGQMEHNALLIAAGFAPVKHDAETNPAARRMMEAAERMLEWQMPNPSVILREDWTIVASNDAARRMVNHFSPGPDLVTLKGLSVVEMIMDPRFLNTSIANIQEIMTYMQTQLKFDATGGIAPHRVLDHVDEGPTAHLPLVLKRGDVEARFETTLVTVGTARDAQIGEIRLETFYPADAVSAAIMESLVREAVA